MTNIARSLHTLLNKDSEEIASVLQMLNDIENNELLQKLDGSNAKIDINLEDLKLKSETLISLLVILLDNPRVKIDLRKEGTNEDLIKKFKEVSYRVSRGYYELTNNADEKNIWLIQTVLLAIIADREPEVDLLIKNQLHHVIHTPETLSKNYLQKICFNIMVEVIKRVETNDDINQLRQLITKSEDVLLELQEAQLANEAIDLKEGFYITGLANILYILKAVTSYMVTGRVSDETSNIETLIDSYCFNALKLFSENDHSLYAITTLLRPALRQLVANSIWKVVDRSPILRNYFENNLNLGKDIILTFLPSQRESILDLLTSKKSIVLNMPTSSGKSLLAELYILFNLHNYRTDTEKPTVAYVVPTNALTNQVYHRLEEVFKAFDYRVETALPYYQVDEIEEEILNKEHIDVLITTPEKLDFLIRKDHISLKNLKLVVVDEAHNISDKNRGAKLELLLATIKQQRHDVSYLLLSPFIKNAEDIATWLADSEEAGEAVSISWAPTKQFVGCNLLKNNKSESSVLYLPSGRNDIVKKPVEINLQINPSEVKSSLNANTIGDLVKGMILIQKYLKLGSVMVLCEGPGSTEGMATKALEYLKNKRLLNRSEDIEIVKAIELIKQETEHNEVLIDCLYHGVAFHHSRMSSLIKEAIEKLIKKKKIKLIFATTTLAQGMNFPITTVIFNSLRLGGGASSRELTNVEFWNISGRAGRAFMDEEGHIVTPYSNNQKDSIDAVKKYIVEDIADISSSLNEMMRFLENQDIFEYRFIKDNPTTSNFFQYLSHILNVTYDYNIDRVDTTKIRNILNSSLFFNRLTFEEGFIESQEKISTFAFRYLNHLREKQKGELKLADLFGVSDITFNKFKAALYAYKKRMIEEHGEPSIKDFLTASKIILTDKDNLKLAEVIKLVSYLPEIKMALFERGSFDPESIAKIIIGWVDGKKINQIVDDIAYPKADKKEVLGKCTQYVNSNLKSYVPWGLSIFQTLTNDSATDDAKNLPSYIYYGVNSKELVILSKIGVPRFAVKAVRDAISSARPELTLNVDNMENIKNVIKTLPASTYNALNGNHSNIKALVDDNI